MFNSVGHPRHIILITEASHIDIHSSARLVRLGIMNYESFELVREENDPIGPVI
jgi:hypothetical protein